MPVAISRGLTYLATSSSEETTPKRVTTLVLWLVDMIEAAIPMCSIERHTRMDRVVWFSMVLPLGESMGIWDGMRYFGVELVNLYRELFGIINMDALIISLFLSSTLFVGTCRAAVARVGYRVSQEPVKSSFRMIHHRQDFVLLLVVSLLRHVASSENVLVQ